MRSIKGSAFLLLLFVHRFSENSDAQVIYFSISALVPMISIYISRYFTITCQVALRYGFSR